MWVNRTFFSCTMTEIGQRVGTIRTINPKKTALIIYLFGAFKKAWASSSLLLFLYLGWPLLHGRRQGYSPDRTSSTCSSVSATAHWRRLRLEQGPGVYPNKVIPHSVCIKAGKNVHGNEHLDSICIPSRGRNMHIKNTILPRGVFLFFFFLWINGACEFFQILNFIARFFDENSSS
jgi:hypothetical protein